MLEYKRRENFLFLFPELEVSDERAGTSTHKKPSRFGHQHAKTIIVNNEKEQIIQINRSKFNKLFRFNLFKRRAHKYHTKTLFVVVPPTRTTTSALRNSINIKTQHTSSPNETKSEKAEMSS